MKHFYVAAMVWLATAVVVSAITEDTGFPVWMCLALAVYHLFVWAFTVNESDER